MTPRRFAVLFALLFAAHVGVMLYMSPASVVLGREPMISLDFSTHYEQCKRAVEAWQASGRTWLWDPHLLAGQPSGAIFDADNKLWEVFCIALVKLGVRFDRAFNLFAWLVSIGVFPVVVASARLLGARPRAALIAGSLAALVWWFDGFTHWLWFVGMVCWAAAAYWFLLPLGLLVAYVRERKRWQLVLLGPVLALVHTLHPYTFLALAGPMLVLYVRERKALSRNEHAAILAAAALTVLANLWWLKTALRFWHYILDSGYYLDATPDFVLWDWLAITKEPWVTGVLGNRSGFRSVALVACAAALYRMRKEKDARLPWLWPALLFPLFVAYVGSLVPLLRQVQPYRFVLPAIMLATVFAGELFDDLAAPIALALRERGAVAAMFGVLVLVGAPRLLRDVLYFVPDLVPRHKKPLPLAPPNIGGPLEFGTQGWPEPFVYRHAPDALFPAIEDFVKKRDDGRGRWLVEWWMTGEQLAGRTNAQVLGGFREINLAHSDANFFRVQPEDRPVDVEAFRKYLETFNVQWVVLVKHWPALEARRDLLEPVPGPLGGLFFRTRLLHNWFLPAGPGLVQASNDRIVVTGSAGGSLVLKYHFLETLRCKPGCTVRKVEVAGTRVGFIGVDGAPPDFEVYNP
ncbi:MAG: hypothetical protein JNL79_07740 [Myxococcales bacterium]|nr:hypothetical protein [Myxococcales bacterium]